MNCVYNSNINKLFLCNFYFVKIINFACDLYKTLATTKYY